MIKFAIAPMLEVINLGVISILGSYLAGCSMVCSVIVGEANKQDPHLVSSFGIRY